MRDCFGHVTSCQEAGRGRGLETMETSGCSRIMWETRWRVEMCTYLLCVSFSFEGLPLNGNFRDNNVNVYTLFCSRFEHDACLLSCRQRKRCHVDQCGAVYLNRLTRLESFQRDHGERVRFVSESSSWKYWSVLFDCGRKGAMGEEDQFCIWNAKLEKHPLLARHTMEK